MSICMSGCDLGFFNFIEDCWFDADYCVHFCRLVLLCRPEVDKKCPFKLNRKHEIVTQFFRSPFVSLVCKEEKERKPCNFVMAQLSISPFSLPCSYHILFAPRFYRHDSNLIRRIVTSFDFKPGEQLFMGEMFDGHKIYLAAMQTTRSTLWNKYVAVEIMSSFLLLVCTTSTNIFFFCFAKKIFEII